MKSVCIVILLFWVIAGCNGQVQVPVVDVQPVIDSLNVLKARVATLESQAVEVKSGQTSFSGADFRKAVYVPGLTTAWRVFVQAIASTDTPPYEYILRREVKQDSIIVLRQPGGAANLTIEWLAVLP